MVLPALCNGVPITLIRCISMRLYKAPHCSIDFWIWASVISSQQIHNLINPAGSMLCGLLPAHHTWRIVCAGNTCSCTSSFECAFLVVSYQVNLYLLPGFFHFFLQARQCFGVFNLWQDVLNEFIKLLEVILHLADCSCIFTQ